MVRRGDSGDDGCLQTAVLVSRLPGLAEQSDVVDFLIQDVLVPEGSGAWETPEALQNVLQEALIDLDVCYSELEAQLLCEDLQKAFQQPSPQAVRLSSYLSNGISLPEALLSSQSPETEEQLPPGTCVMCERHMPLTWHHLYPREVQKKFLKRGLMTEADKLRGINICRQCHNTIHRSFDNEMLAGQLHSVESLLEQEVIQKWVSYASKQKARAVVGHRVSR